MRKILTVLLLSFILMSQASPVMAFTLVNPIGITSIEDLIRVITNYIFYLAIIIAPVMIIIGAFMFMTSAGDPKKVSTGKNIILWTVVGLAVILFSKGIMSLIKSVLGA